MKTIFLLRHAKSSWDDITLDDFDRPLSHRGIKSCEKIGKFIKKKKIIPVIVYCSNAIRAKQTWELTNRIIKKKENIFFSNALYMANLNSFITFVHKTIDSFSSLMIVSHNPGIENFALELIKNKKNKFYDNISMKYPTAALAIILFDEKKWSNIKIGTGKIIDFIKPRDL